MWNIGDFDLTAQLRGKAFGVAVAFALAVLALLALVLPAGPALSAGAQRSYTVTTETRGGYTVTTETIVYVDYGGSAGFVENYAAPQSPALATYGPFHVVAEDRIEMIGEVDSYAPQEFRRLLADWPGIRTLDFVDCAGTIDDNANLALARMIRRAGITTHVPGHGSVRSGGVELFLAGVRRTADPGAEFIVHSWLDNYGREAADYPPGDPIHAPYLEYYREMGMAPENARAFYALTNSVPHDSMRQISITELAAFDLLH
ncbi:hypothetical protein HFP57_14580 [Parasphingopyxis algicola]|uniref:hypothetical protein n=1 Tax=Parasphingopyxis algicola TaxID=2026624 RepID=UPI0015A32446|nr:hypothetical protein [Parasphingopyxis algicola]QLC26127.1 hypothetical protein HFP57_14580 [Parasphingopyxis algicola]